MKKHHKIAVIGSGPIGVACAYTIIQKFNLNVDMIDVGREMDDETKTIKLCGKNKSKEEFLAEINNKRINLINKKGVVPKKLYFGSDYIYKETNDFKINKDKSCKFDYSFAKGGLGKIWGANISSILQKDINSWPITEKDLLPYFKFLEDIMPISSNNDLLGKRFQYKIKGEYSFTPTDQAKYLIKKSNNNIEILSDNGIFVGRAKLAVSNEKLNFFNKCISCGLCMHGCPQDSIFDPSNIIEKVLMKRNNFRYFPNYLVSDIEEINNGSVILKVKNLSNNKELKYEYSKVFIACGTIGSTALIAKSKKEFSKKILISDSHKYLFPFFLNKPFPNTVSEQKNTLAQIFIHLEKLTSTSKLVHIQLYSFNDLMLEPIKKIFGERFKNFIIFLCKPIFSRLMVGMAYFPSEVSGKLFLKLEKDKEYKLKVSGEKNKNSKLVFKEIIKKVNLFSNEIGGKIFPLGFLEHLPGVSQHFGASMPMQKHPKGFQTDTLGRPLGMNSTYVVDTSVLTEIPSTPTTFLSMANASRIAHLSLIGEGNEK